MTASPSEVLIHASDTDDRRARRNVWVLVAAQAILGSQITSQFVIGALAGQSLAPIACLATLPISMIVFGSMTTAPWLSSVMQSRGRRTGFLIGVAGGTAGTALSALAVWLHSFPLLLLGGYLTGIYMSAQGFYRFAAADTASDAFRPKAISYVLAGGLVSAVIGPQMVSWFTGAADLGSARFLPVYAAGIVLNLAGLWLFFLLDIPRPPAPAANAPRGRSRREMLRDPVIVVSIVCAMVAYALMNLVMTSTPLAMVGTGHGVPDASNVVMAHVLGMFAPSFFTGHLIARFGAVRIVSAGLALLGLAGVVALWGVDLHHFYLALILIGVGWNFGFIGATTMLASAHDASEKGRIQGLNDALVMGCVTVASLASGGLMNCSGGSAVQGWTAVNIAMVPFLTLAGAALIWLAANARQTRI